MLPNKSVVYTTNNLEASCICFVYIEIAKKYARSWVYVQAKVQVEGCLMIEQVHHEQTNAL